MARDVLEKVFVAWGGNQRLAVKVANALSALGFDSVVGGGHPTELFIGSQVFSQIRGCTRAIILVQADSGADFAPGTGFNDNLMFEWGYITGLFAPGKIHVFLIGISVKDLPSDLAGSWATEVPFAGHAEEDVAEMIASRFQNDAMRHVDLDKLRIMHSWDSVKHSLDVYNESPQVSDLELANYLIHTVEVCDYFMEEEYLSGLLNKMKPASSLLDFTVNLVKANIQLSLETDGLRLPLSFDSFTELRAIFEAKFDFSYLDEELNLWLRYFVARRVSLIYRLVAENEGFSPEEMRAFLATTLEVLSSAAHTLDEIASRFPPDAKYSNLYRGYVERDRFRVYRSLGMAEEATASNAAAQSAKESFYLDYKQAYPGDSYMIRQLAQEYYRSLAERLEFVTDLTERLVITKTVSSFLSRLDKDSGRQHVVLQELRSKLNA